jgi:hypothetical protein
MRAVPTESHDVEQGPRHALLLAFDTDEPSFARGFEAGALWADLQADEAAEVEAIVHASNTEMMLRMGEALGRAAVGTELDGTWTRIAFGPTAGPSP